MQYRAIVKHVGDWYIGWLVDIPGVNAQEKTYEEVLISLQIGAEDMLATPIECDADAQMVYVTVRDNAAATAHYA